jgi:DNA-damage-inducible protein D
MSERDERETLAQGPQTSPFDAIRHEDAEGNEWWSARELATILDYPRWQKFRPVIDRAMEACENSGHATSDHFTREGKMIATGKGAQRQIEDWRLSRYACYLVIQNADPDKPVVALGQTYFASQTRRQELADEQALAGLSEDQRRLYTRAQLTEHNRQLASAAASAGVITARDFAVFQDHGYMGLYNGERARDIAARKGLKPGQHILDHMGSTELAANLFRATQADDKIRREGIQGKDAANATHFAVGRAVRRFIVEELGGSPSEELPTPPESIQQVQRRERARLEREAQTRRQPSLFGAGESDGASNDADMEEPGE